MRLHVLGFPFSELTRDWSHCAFTDRTRIFCDMMAAAGWDVTAYGGQEHGLHKKVEHVSLCTRDEQAEWFPDYKPKRDVFNDFDPDLLPWKTFNVRAAAAISERAESRDIVCYTMGTSQQQVASELSDIPLLHVETGIGYSGIWAPHRIFESHAWRHYLAAREKTDTVRFYDTVLPRAFDLTEYPVGDGGGGGYYLFIGRLTERKGPHVAAEACKRIGAKLVVAGQGDYPFPPEVERVGVVNSKDRAWLMGGAIGIFCPSLYLEPFCGVSVEAQLCGTPVIASNWGGLVENIDHGTTGFLCNTLAEFADGAIRAVDLNRKTIATRARRRWSTKALAPQYTRYLTGLGDLFGDGWYS